MKNKKVLILGTGAWGSALASVLSKNGHTVNMFGTNEAEVCAIKNGKFSFALNHISTDIKEVIQDVSYLVFAIPTEAYQNLVETIKPFIHQDMIFIIGSKGLEPNSGLELDIFLNQHFIKNPVCYILGPGFASEVLQEKKTAINAIANDLKVAEDVSLLFSNDNFLLVPMVDNLGASICSSFKNALAILFGLMDAYEISINTKSAILALGIKEIESYLKLKHADKNTINELCGIGDIFLTCTSPLSRNYQFGKNLAHTSVKAYLKQNPTKTVEGYKFLLTFFKQQTKHQNLIIFYAIYLLINGDIKPNEIIDYIWGKYYDQKK